MRRIDELVMRVPGVDADTGRVIAASVARRLADRLPALALRSWPERLDVVVRVAPNAPPRAIVDAITDAIVRSFQEADDVRV